MGISPYYSIVLWELDCNTALHYGKITMSDTAEVGIRGQW